MKDSLINLETTYIRLRGWIWNLLQLAAILMVIIGAVRLFSPYLALNSDGLSNAILAIAEIIEPLPDVGGATYLFGGLIATLFVSSLR